MNRIFFKKKNKNLFLSQRGMFNIFNLSPLFEMYVPLAFSWCNY